MLAVTPNRRRTANRYPHLASQIREVTARHAMVNNRGALLCQPRTVETLLHPHGYPPWAGNDGKICYPGQQAAEQAAAEINAIEGADPVVAYPCPRGGHWHHVDRARRARTVAAIVERIAAAPRKAQP